MHLRSLAWFRGDDHANDDDDDDGDVPNRVMQVKCRGREAHVLYGISLIACTFFLKFVKLHLPNSKRLVRLARTGFVRN